MKFPPWLSLYFRMSTALFGIVITAAQGAPEHFGGTAIADDISFWLGFVILLQNGVFSFGGTGNQTSLSLAGKVE